MYVNGYSLCAWIFLNKGFFLYLPFSIVSLETNSDVKDESDLIFNSSIRRFDFKFDSFEQGIGP